MQLSILLWLGCQTEHTIDEWSRNPEALKSQCQSETSPELQTTCWVQLAALEGSLGNEFKGIEACAEIAKLPLSKTHPETQQIWEWECAFRLGEELSASGQTAKGLRHCTMAGRFTQNCITHSIWRTPNHPDLHSTLSASKLWATAQETHTLAMGHLQSLSTDLQQDASNQLIGQFGLQIYLGSGVADPEPAHLTDQWGASLRTGYALERVRMATAETNTWTSDQIQALFDDILQDWQQNQTTKGNPHPNALTLGRYAEARLSPLETEYKKLHLYGGGRRLVHSKPSIDMQIALIEAFFWYPHTPPIWFTRWLDHEEDTIKNTGAKLFCLSNGLRSNIGSKLPTTPGIDWHFSTCPLRK